MSLINTTKYYTLDDFNEWQDKAIEKEESIYKKNKLAMVKILEHLNECQLQLDISQRVLKQYYNITFKKLWESSQLKIWANNKIGK